MKSMIKSILIVLCLFVVFSSIFQGGEVNSTPSVNEDIGILDYCKEHNILFINYQPFRRNRTANHNYPLLVELANKYNKTQNQILLNYYVKEKSIIPITKANKIEHIKLNLKALDFEMDQQDYQRLNDFRCEEFDKLEVDWLDNGGIPIYKFANQVE